MKKSLIILTIVGVTALLPSCKNQGTKEKASLHSEKSGEGTAHKDCKDVHWTYHESATSPENWPNLCDGFSDCGGSVQSPININTEGIAQDESLPVIKFNYGKSGVKIENNGHTVEFMISGNNTINLNDKEYKLLQFHYHSLSEHMVDNKHYPLELHLVHKYSDTDFAVIGVLFKEGAENELFSKFLSDFPKTVGEYKSADSIDIIKLLPAEKSYFHYNGSLTTPPCSEVVDWYVLSTPLTASKEQLEMFSKILKNNYRPVKPLNGREVKMHKE